MIDLFNIFLLYIKNCVLRCVLTTSCADIRKNIFLLLSIIIFASVLFLLDCFCVPGDCFLRFAPKTQIHITNCEVKSENLNPVMPNVNVKNVNMKAHILCQYCICHEYVCIMNYSLGHLSRNITLARSTTSFHQCFCVRSYTAISSHISILPYGFQL